MTSVRLSGSPLPPDNLLFDSDVYDLHWDGNKLVEESTSLDLSVLPGREFALHLIESVKFHCCQLFYLFEEGVFMEEFALFHANPSNYAQSSPLWYTHYLLILAFGKEFVVRSNRSGRPPGVGLFLQAMKCMPDFAFSETDPIQKMQILCCISLYLQCLCFRTAAHRAVSAVNFRSRQN